MVARHEQARDVKLQIFLIYTKQLIYDLNQLSQLY